MEDLIVSRSDLVFFAKLKSAVFLTDDAALSVRNDLERVFKPSLIHTCIGELDVEKLDAKNAIVIGEDLDNIPLTNFMRAFGRRAICQLLDPCKEFMTNGSLYLKSFVLSDRMIYFCASARGKESLASYHNGHIVSKPEEAAIIIYDVCNSQAEIMEWIEARECHSAKFFTVAAFFSALNTAESYEDLISISATPKIFSGLRFSYGALSDDVKTVISERGGTEAEEGEFVIVVADLEPSMNLLLEMYHCSVLMYVEYGWIEKCLESDRLLSPVEYGKPLDKFPNFFELPMTGTKLFIHESVDTKARQVIHELEFTLVERQEDAYGIVAAPFLDNEIEGKVPIRNLNCLCAIKKNGPHTCSHYTHQCFVISSSVLESFLHVKIVGIEAEEEELLFIQSLVEFCSTKTEHSGYLKEEIIIWDEKTNAEKVWRLLDEEKIVVLTSFIREALAGEMVVDPKEHIFRRDKEQGQVRDINESTTYACTHTFEAVRLGKALGTHILMRLLNKEPPLQLEVGKVVTKTCSWKQHQLSMELTFDADIDMLGTGVVNDFTSNASLSIIAGGVFYDKDNECVERWIMKLLGTFLCILEELGVVGGVARKSEQGLELLLLFGGELHLLFSSEIKPAMQNGKLSRFAAGKFQIPAALLRLLLAKPSQCSPLALVHLLVVCEDGFCFCNQPFSFNFNFRCRYYHSMSNVPESYLKAAMITFRRSGKYKGTLISNFTDDGDRKLLCKDERDLRLKLASALCKSDQHLCLQGEGLFSCSDCAPSETTAWVKFEILCEINGPYCCSKCKKKTLEVAYYSDRL